MSNSFRTASDPYDANGNLLNCGVGSNIYDFENHLVAAGGVSLAYDGDGNRAKETVAGVATSYLVADQNLTGYAQVMDDLKNGSVSRTYSYGLSLISQRLTANGQGLSFYGFDGHGSVRFLTSSTGAVTVKYDYDAFGNLIASTGSTPNNFRFAGEQFDPALGIYYNRARYYDQRQGRFWSMDTFEGKNQDPATLHKYLYAGANPVDRLDASGNDFDLGSTMESLAINTTISSLSTLILNSPLGNSIASFVASQFIPTELLQALANKTPDAVEVSLFGQVSLNARIPVGVTGFGGFDFLVSPKTGNTALYAFYGAGLSAGQTASSGGVGGSIGVVFNCQNSSDYEGPFISLTVPAGSLASQLRKKTELEILQVSVTSFLGNVPVAYSSLTAILGTITTSEISAGKSVTFFWSPTKRDEGGVSFGAGISGSLGTSTTNSSLTVSEYTQLAPSQSVPFR